MRIFALYTKKRLLKDFFSKMCKTYGHYVTHRILRRAKDASRAYCVSTASS